MVLYREIDPSLPDLGWNRAIPWPVSAEAVTAINECTHVGALGAMAGAARSFWGAAGAIVSGPPVGAAFWALGWHVAAAVAFLIVVPAAAITIEARRRAIQWESVVAARISSIGSAPASSSPEV